MFLSSLSVYQPVNSYPLFTGAARFFYRGVSCGTLCEVSAAAVGVKGYRKAESSASGDASRVLAARCGYSAVTLPESAAFVTVVALLNT